MDETAVLAFLGGSMAPHDRATVEHHIAACSACADLVTWAAADQASVTRLPGQEGRPFIGQLQPGARIGRYQILGALGRGGMGEVYAAYHPDLDRRIAIKIVQGGIGNSDERRTRLLREARAIARLSHPNVITVHDAGTFGDRVFIAMELVDGWTIDQWLSGGARGWREILDVFMAAGRGLAAAHRAGIIHRDFKPQNVMIAKDGAVRVMDFGLARVTAEPSGGVAHDGGDAPTVRLTNVTKTGAFIGTPAYMSPEQFRRDSIDERSDQFSFCVALHEALFGTRPLAASDGGDGPTGDLPTTRRRPAIPAWPRTVLERGASAAREQRHPSMDALLAALDRGRTRVKRRVSVAAVVLSALIASAGAWRVAHGNRIACAVPEDRLAAVWSTLDASNPRRQAIHQAFTASGRATAETSWQRVSKVLDEYVTAWGAMYVQTCEATHVRGEQSGEVLDLRMSCLNDNLDQVRALTAELASSNTNGLSNAVTAARNLTPVARCADIALLRSAVPLPRDETTLHEVQRLRRGLADVHTLWDIGDAAGVFKRVNLLRPEIEATGYKPLLGELLYFVGMVESELDPDPTKGEATLRRAMLTAETARDDLTAARICASLVYVSGYRLGQFDEAEFWAGLGHAILDRRGTDDPRMRSWLDGNLGGSFARAGDFERARVLISRSVRLKEGILGPEHPDYATGLGDLAYVLARSGHANEARDVAVRAIDIFVKHGDPDGVMIGITYGNLGEALLALGNRAQAEDAFQHSMRNLTRNVGRTHPETAFALQGLGAIRLARSAPDEAIPLLEDALLIRQQPHADPVLTAESQFALAQALWDNHRDRVRARQLAAAAAALYAAERREKLQGSVDAWLTEHRTKIK